MASKRFWRAPTVADRKRKCRARSPYINDGEPYYVEWNRKFGAWHMAGKPHLMVTVREILSAPGELPSKVRKPRVAKPARRFRVYFAETPSQSIDVLATSAERADAIACKEYRKLYGVPACRYAEPIK